MSMSKRLMSHFASAALLLAGLAAAPGDATAFDVDVNVFYDRLSPYGTWQYHPSYGRVWSPRGVRNDWRPYTEGHWAWTYDYGWLWVEDEPWGWATYHYGRWLFDPRLGWLWMPGNQWAPAWVRWRHGGGHVGWAPLAPYGIDTVPGYWVFVPENRFLSRRLRPVVYYPTRYQNYFDDCRVVGSVSRHRDHWVNDQVDWHRIEHVTKTKIVPLRVRDSETVASPRFDRDRSELTVFRPGVKGTPEQWRKRSLEGATSAPEEAGPKPERQPAEHRTFERREEPRRADERRMQDQPEPPKVRSLEKQEPPKQRVLRRDDRRQEVEPRHQPQQELRRQPSAEPTLQSRGQRRGAHPVAIEQPRPQSADSAPARRVRGKQAAEVEAENAPPAQENAPPARQGQRRFGR
jgi:hypothetical protein